MGEGVDGGGGAGVDLTVVEDSDVLVVIVLDDDDDGDVLPLDGDVLPPIAIPIEPTNIAATNPPPNRLMIPPTNVKAKPPQSTRSPRPAAASPNSVSKNPPKTASSAKLRRRLTGLAASDPDEALSVFGRGGAIAGMSRPQCLQTMAASLMSSAQNGHALIVAPGEEVPARIGLANSEALPYSLEGTIVEQ